MIIGEPAGSPLIDARLRYPADRIERISGWFSAEPDPFRDCAKHHLAKIPDESNVTYVLVRREKKTHEALSVREAEVTRTIGAKQEAAGFPAA